MDSILIDGIDASALEDLINEWKEARIKQAICKKQYIYVFIDASRQTCQSQEG